MDEPLRNGLWSLLKLECWDYVYEVSLSYSSNREINLLCQQLWFRHFKRPLDELDDYWPNTVGVLRRRFFGCEWYDVYEFVEFVAQNYGSTWFQRQIHKGV